MLVHICFPFPFTHTQADIQPTCCQVYHGGSASCDGIYLGVDLMLRLIHLVLTPSFGGLREEKTLESTLV